MVYEAAMSWLNPEKTYNPSHHAFAGAVAGGAAAVAALPLDACKTLLNTQEVLLDKLIERIISLLDQVNVLKQLNVQHVIGMRGAASTIYRMAGVGGFYQGLRARIFFVMPGTAISWFALLLYSMIYWLAILSFRSTYEAFKYYLSPSTPPPVSEDTLKDLQQGGHLTASRNRGERARGERGCEGGSSWESVVTDLPLREPSIPMGELVTREQRTLLYGDHSHRD